MVKKTKVKCKKPKPNATLEELRECIEEMATVINNLNIVIFTNNGKLNGVRMNPSGRPKIDDEKWNRFLKNPISRGNLPRRLHMIAEKEELEDQ